MNLVDCGPNKIRTSVSLLQFHMHKISNVLGQVLLDNSFQMRTDVWHKDEDVDWGARNLRLSA